jgi:cell fate regulator YaaT (PSP1 superfamily)
MNPFIVGIRFQKIGKVYHFDASETPDLKVGDFVVVDTARGRQLGEVAQIVANPTPPPEGAWKPIQRRASPRDLVLRQLWQKKELEALINCRAKLAEINLPGVKIVAAEFTFDGGRLSFLFSTESEAKVDTRRLQASMQRLYPKPRIEMRQIGPRDVAKYLGGMGACGLENRCCSMFLTEFSPISIKMAKEQGISLTPTEITGMCGRLRCCLIYEYEQYVEARKSLPKRNKRVITPQGEGKVWDVYPLKQTVIVELDNGVRGEYPAADLQPWDELEALRRKSQEPCDRHENGECNCGKSSSAPAAVAPAEEDDLGYEGEPLDMDKALPANPLQPPARHPHPSVRPHGRPGENSRGGKGDSRSDRPASSDRRAEDNPPAPTERRSEQERSQRPNRPDRQNQNRQQGPRPDANRPRRPDNPARSENPRPEPNRPESGRPNRENRGEAGDASRPDNFRRNKSRRHNRGPRPPKEE